VYGSGFVLDRSPWRGRTNGVAALLTEALSRSIRRSALDAESRRLLGLSRLCHHLQGPAAPTAKTLAGNCFSPTLRANHICHCNLSEILFTYQSDLPQFPQNAAQSSTSAPQ
jgi:hypothetical protein